MNRMNGLRKSVAAALALTVSGCAGSGIEGEFAPACIAHAGDRVSLAEGRFEWTRFTDEVKVDADGNRIEPFPGYPKSGSFASGKYSSLVFSADDGTPIDDYYLLEHRGRTYLLTYDQNEAVLDGDAMPACALVLAERE
ncbi:MAG: hypothetical protein QNJ00_03570 [Woeseiaceae bacterium]|nr:hypothetical protein [Woeseiaceae bacterium]